MKKETLLKTIVILALITIVVMVVSWFAGNKEAIDDAMDGVNLYTQEDVNNAYDEGYSTASNEKATLEEQLVALKISLDELKAYKITSEAEKTELISQINSLRSTIEIKEMNIAYKEHELELSQSEVAELKAEVAELKGYIAYYEDYISSIQGTDFYLCTFKVGDDVHVVKKVNAGSTIGSIPQVESTDYSEFSHWEIDGVMVDDITNYVVDSNLTIEAVMINRALVTFYAPQKVNGAMVYVAMSIVDERIVICGNTIAPPTAPTFDNFNFIGWSTTQDSSGIVSFSFYTVNDHTSLYAIYEKVSDNATFIANGQVLEMREVAVNEQVGAPPTAPTFAEWRFVGWTADGYTELLSNEDVASRTLTIDRTFTAMYEKVSAGYFVCNNDPSYYLEINATATTIVNYGGDNLVVKTTTLINTTTASVGVTSSGNLTYTLTYNEQSNAWILKRSWTSSSGQTGSEEWVLNYVHSSSGTRNII